MSNWSNIRNVGDFKFFKLQNAFEYTSPSDVPDYILSNLTDAFEMRDYQKEAIQYTIADIKKHGNADIHYMYHMATGSGKTYIMAAMILCFYNLGYNTVLFLASDKAILEKTKINFLHKNNRKYLFKNKIIIDGKQIAVNEISSLSDCRKKNINILFTTIQKLHEDLHNTKENSLTLQDFAGKKILIIADEAHHLNASTLGNAADEERSWENTINSIRYQAPEEIAMLEFTATGNLNSETIHEKYKDKVIYNYDLLQYRKDGYTKNFKNIKSSFAPKYRVLNAMLLSQCRLKMFEERGIFCKPVILIKSATTKKSKEFYNELIDYIKHEITGTDIDIIRRMNIESNEKMFLYFDERNISNEQLIKELKRDFSETHLRIINSKTKQDQKAKILNEVNTLEDNTNPVRMIFTVDMLHEGWDVLNLFDIVRADDNKGTSKSTTQEAQLIGRGVRYFPFSAEGKDIYKRKYDNNINNPFRLCETLFFHSTNDSAYISNLNKALIEEGFKSKHECSYKYTLKESFKSTDTFKKGIIFVNSLVKSGNASLILNDAFIDTVFCDNRKRVDEVDFFTNIVDNSEAKIEKEISVSEYARQHYNVVYKIIRQFPLFQFNMLSQYFPDLESVKEFIVSETYAGKFKICLWTDETPSITDYYSAFYMLFDKLSKKIKQSKVSKYNGDTVFTPVKISDVVSDVERLCLKSRTGGEGVSQSDYSVDARMRIDLSSRDWFVYDDNYGTPEEKAFVAFFSRKIKTLEAKGYEKIYLIRNERKIKIYDFDSDNGFEPDYILLMSKNNNMIQMQYFIEPKGDGFIANDEWKESFLKRINCNYHRSSVFIDDIDLSSDEYVIIGLPFYNQNQEIAFEKEFDSKT